MSIDNGGSAFPALLQSDDHRLMQREDGMSLRDYFAAKAMAGFLAHPESDYAPLIDDKPPMLAREAYRLADAMLKARAAKAAEGLE